MNKPQGPSKEDFACHPWPAVLSVQMTNNRILVLVLVPTITSSTNVTYLVFDLPAREIRLIPAGRFERR